MRSGQSSSLRVSVNWNQFILGAIAVAILPSAAPAQLGPIGFPRSALTPPPEPTAAVQPVPAPGGPTIEATPPPPPGGIYQMFSFSATGVARAAGVFDTTQLKGFAAGTFMPAAIPVRGENFFESGENATLQGSGSAIQLALVGQTPSGGSVKIQTAILANATTPDPSTMNAQLAYASVQYENLVIGLLDTGFADPDCIIPTIDLEGPNAIATITGPTGGNSEGRLGYMFDFSGSPYVGWIGSINIEQPTPEIAFASGMTPATTFSRFAHVPDLITTLKFVDGELTTNPAVPVTEYWHVQLGSVVRDLGLENGNRTIDDSVVGWGVQLSGACVVFERPSCGWHDVVGTSVVYGHGIGHYINDLHVLNANQSTGGNDAILNGTRLEVLPALAYYAGYLHQWNDNWQTSLGFSRVELSGVPGQVPTAYHMGDYAVLNLIYHEPVKFANPAAPTTATVQNLYAGVECLYGLKEELNGHTGHDERVMFMISLNK